MSAINPPPRRAPASLQQGAFDFWASLLSAVYLIFERVRRVNFGSVSVSTGTGSPESVVTGSPGDLYVNLSGGASTTLYVKESGTGNTGWVGK